MSSSTLSKKIGQHPGSIMLQDSAVASSEFGKRSELRASAFDIDRIERDPLGERHVPADAYYGIQTARALENFPISGLRAPPELVTATVLVKKAAAEANARARPARSGRSPTRSSGPPTRCSAGALRDQFVVDVYQAGAGTSHNMNANEVLANRAAELLGGARGDYTRVHPNDHVNMGQSTNDVFPTATRLALLLTTHAAGRGARARWRSACERKAERVRAGPEGGPHAPAGRGADDARPGVRRLRRVRARAAPTTSSARRRQLQELNLGATAVGTGLNAGDGLRGRGGRQPRRAHRPRRCAPRRTCFRVTQSMGDVVAYSGAVRRLAVEVGKIASDLRLLSMGPRAGLARDRAAGGAARVVDHAGQGEPVDSRDGEPGLLPGDRAATRRSRPPPRPASSS